MRKAMVAFLVAAAMAAAAAPGWAQEGARRQGFGMSIGMGSGSAGITCEDCADVDRLNGISGYLRLGGYVSPQLLVGVEGTGWIRNSDGLERRIAAASVVFLAYPSRTAGFFARGGVGFLRAVIDADLLVAVGEGITWQAGAGWDIPMGAGAAITPFVTYVNSVEVAASINDVSTGYNLNPDILQFGLALTIH